MAVASDALAKYDASPRALRAVDVVRVLPRATTRRVSPDVAVGTAARALVDVVAADVAPRVVVADAVAARAEFAAVVAARTAADVVAVPDELVAVALRDVVAARGTTRRPGFICSVRVITLMGLADKSGVTPGFKSVRIWLLRYGYM